MEDDEIDIDPLFIGMTRPAMILGVPIEFFFLNFILFGMGMVMFLALLHKMMFFCFLIIPLQALGTILTEQDPQWMRVWITKFQKCAVTRNKGFWQSNSFKP